MKKMNIGDTPMDWYIHKFGSNGNDYYLDSFDNVRTSLKFSKSAKKKKKPKKKPSKAITMYKYTTLFLSESGWIDISRYIPLSRIKKLYPTCREVMYSNDLNIFHNFSIL